MSDQPHQESTDKLVEGYRRMLELTHESIDTTQRETRPLFREVLDKARDTLVELGELTREEAHKVADYVQRDIEDAANYIAETGQTMREWWRFDLQLMEQRLSDLFAQVADQTSVQLARWAETARQLSLYQAGEITGPGTLVCDRCGAETHFVRAGRIPACADCGGTVFRRQPVEPPSSTDTE